MLCNSPLVVWLRVSPASWLHDRVLRPLALRKMLVLDEARKDGAFINAQRSVCLCKRLLATATPMALKTFGDLRVPSLLGARKVRCPLEACRFGTWKDMCGGLGLNGKLLFPCRGNRPVSICVVQNRRMHWGKRMYSTQSLYLRRRDASCVVSQRKSDENASAPVTRKQTSASMLWMWGAQLDACRLLHGSQQRLEGQKVHIDCIAAAGFLLRINGFKVNRY